MRIYPSEETDYLADDVPDYLNDGYYNTSHSRVEIRAYLKHVKDCIKAGRFIVLNNDDGSRNIRQKNSDFMNKYGLYTRERQQDLLMSVDVEDFCHSIRSPDGRDLYVFCIQRSLYKAGSGTCSVWVYIKHDCPEGSGTIDVVVSMHELEKPIELIFVD